MALGACNHVVLSGGRMAFLLDAIGNGASAAVVGVLMALFALLPMLFGIHTGRLADRIGARKPMLWGSIGCVVGVALPVLAPGLPALFVAALLIGVSFMLVQVPIQQATGAIGDASVRVGNFSWLALGYSLSGFLGPLIAGFAIDSLGFGWAYALLALMPVIPVAMLASNRPALRVPPAQAEARRGHLLELVRNRKLRSLFVINALFALGWDLHAIFVPLYGSSIGLPAAQIGLILASFAAATLVVRFALPWFARHVDETRMLTLALAGAGIVYLLFPFTTSVLALGALSFVLGLGLGSGQPFVLSLLHANAPPGRVGETVGVRMSLMQAMAVAVPLVFGALGSSVGLLPVCWAVGACLGAGGYYAKRSR